MERRLAAILAADVVGYTSLMGADEAGTLSALSDIIKNLIDPLIATHNGRIVKLMGDGVLAEFSSVVAAVTCAVAWQEKISAMAESHDIRFRIGINLGDIVIQDDDIFGDGVNIAARLETLAEPGGICISSKVYAEVKNKLKLNYEDLGERDLKNVGEPVHVFQIMPNQFSRLSGQKTDKAVARPDKLSVAVLPFDNMSTDPEQEYLADGISEDLITALSKIRWFFVIARNSTFTYKGKAVDIKQVAKDLGVRYVLEGSVRKAGSRVRVTAQLIDATTGNHVWAERYDRQMEDIFDLQDEMTTMIVGAIEPELSAAERELAVAKPPDNLNAWESYQRGLWHMWKYTFDDVQKGLGLLKRATELDPGFSLAYAYMTYCYYQIVIVGQSDDIEGDLEAGMISAQKALSLDEREPVAHFAIGRIYMMQGKHDQSIAALEAALELNPSFAQAFHGLGMTFTLADRLEDAKEACLQSERLSPRDPILWASTVVHALAHLLSRDYEQAVKWARITMQNPRSASYWPHAVLAAGLAHQGHMDEARAEVVIALRELPELSLSYLAKVLPTKKPDGLDPYLEGLKKAGLPE